MHGINGLLMSFDCRTAAAIQGKVIKQSGRKPLSKFLYASSDKNKIASWKSELSRILQIFNVRLIIAA